MIGVVEYGGRGTRWLKVGAHVVSRVALHSGDENGDGTATRRRRNGPGGEAVIRVRAELDESREAVGNGNGIQGDLRICGRNQ